MATPSIEQPGPLLQWPQYEKPTLLASCSDASSDLDSHADTAIINPQRTSVVAAAAPASNLSVDSGHAGVDRTWRPMSTSVDIKHKPNSQHQSPSSSSSSPPPPPPPQRQPPVSELAASQTPPLKMSKSDDSSRTVRGIFSKLSTKILSVGRNNSISDLAKQSESRQTLRRFSLQPEKFLPRREAVGASGLRRSWLFDKGMIPIVSLESLPKERPSAGSLFFQLPVELQLAVVTKLIYSDIIALRKTSRAFNRLITSNEHEIARRQIQRFVEPRYIALYPPDCLTKPSFAYLSRLATKSIAASELSRALVTQLYDDFRDKYFEPHSVDAKPLIIRYMTERLRFSVMIIQHFLEQLAERKLRVDRATGFPTRSDDIQLQEAIMEKYYTTDQLIEASDFYRLTLYLLWQNVSLIGSHERLRRVWALMTDTIPAVQDLTKFMLVGGIPELRNVYRKPKAATRRKAIARFAAKYKNEQARSTKLGAALLPRVSHPPGNVRRYSKLAISPNIFHLWIHPAQNVLFRKELINGLNEFRCIDEIVGLLMDGWEEWAYGDTDDDDDDSDDEENEEEILEEEEEVGAGESQVSESAIASSSIPRQHTSGLSTAV
ncbi:hypothetical protein DRE_05434 [Drechslerella stenobrocha 248]|uniref:F-box domain-containing protein n=1 Tax=Drechslerella stenobrocha 248 TaxID=1043628 RepID=W7HNG2_9PEZI|nr:hypothetical protein DRE_05434 [Drechslerella stenobrocha 248]